MTWQDIWKWIVVHAKSPTSVLGAVKGLMALAITYQVAVLSGNTSAVLSMLGLPGVYSSFKFPPLPSPIVMVLGIALAAGHIWSGLKTPDLADIPAFSKGGAPLATEAQNDAKK